MHKEQKKMEHPITIVGLRAHTSYSQELDLHTSQIGPLVSRYWAEHIANHIPHRTNPGITFALYTDYENNYKGTYSYFIGEEVTLLQALPEGLSPISIPVGIYTKFTTHPGAIPEIMTNAWQQIWHMPPIDLGGTRCYRVDFEVYDNRAKNPHHAIADIYIGITPNNN